MKIIYVILFLTDTILLLFLTYLLFKFIDNDADFSSILLDLFGILISIALLVLLLINYLKIPPTKGQN